MNVEDFLRGVTAVPQQMDIDEVIALVEDEAKEEFVTSLTPSGLEVFYSWHPRRYYKLRIPDAHERTHAPGNYDWREVPSVTKILDVLDKSGALSWWSQGVAAQSILELVRRGDLSQAGAHLRHKDTTPATKESVVALLVSEQLSINHVKDSAAKRGVNVHSAFERWSVDQSYRPIVDTYPTNEQGYIRGLIAFLDDLGEVEDVESEVMVGSMEHGFAGRFDVRMRLPEPREMVTRIYPKRAPKRETVPAGRWLDDVKTSKRVYETHAAQLAGYELASVEDGYEPTDYQAVIHLTDDGRYELVQTHATAQDFLTILAAHKTMSNSKGWT